MQTSPRNFHTLLAGAVLIALSPMQQAVAQITRISVDTTGTQANAGSYDAALSDNGQVIAFRSTANNLVAGDTNKWPDIFVRDLATGTTEMASRDIDSERLYSQKPTISDDGQIVAMQAYSNISRIAVLDRSSGVTTVATSDGDALQEPRVSGNGQFIAFFSRGTMGDFRPVGSRPVNPGDDQNFTTDAFVYDRIATPAIPMQRVSRDALGVESNGDSMSPTLSDDGRYVAFYSYTTNLVAGDTNEHEDIFVKDRQTAGIVMASVSSDGTIGNGDSYKPVIAGAGRYVAFRSQATNLVAGDTNKHWDIFVRDMTLGQTTRVSVSSSGGQSNHDSFEADISDDGRYVVFRSNASNLVADDTNQRFDIFVHDRQTSQTLRVSKPASGESNGHSYQPAISGDGQWIVFESDSTNLVAGDSNTARDIFRVPNPLATAPVVNANASQQGGN